MQASYYFENMKKSFELVEYEDRKILAVDGEAFDWDVDNVDVPKLRLACKKDTGIKDGFVGSIKHHFITCLGEFLGRKITFREINDSLEKGYIEL